MVNIIYVKNMVCPRCISAVKTILNKLEVRYLAVGLGEISLDQELNDDVKQSLQKELESIGFALINDRKSQLIEKMKSLVVRRIHHPKGLMEVKWPYFISSKLNLDYKYLSALFSSVESITFEQYIIHQKIERVKELLVYDEMSLSEIAYQLDYSSVAYLSNQFKKITGMTPTSFKNSVVKNRKSLDQI